jgi:predicted ArsR family transcriptional regulator
MTSPAGAVLMDEIVRLVDSDRVVIGAVARTLGLSRQGVQMHLVNRKVARMSV